MSDSDPPVSEERMSWITDFDKLVQELGIPYAITFEVCPPGSLQKHKAVLRVLKQVFLGYGDTKMSARASAANSAFCRLRLQDERQIRRKIQSSQFGAVKAKRGTQNESTVLQALQELRFDRPLWFGSARQATPEEDKRKIDIVVETTDVGLLFLQVKSSRIFALDFADKKRSTLIGVIVASHTEDLKEVNDRAMEVLSRLREQVLAKRGHSTCG